MNRLQSDPEWVRENAKREAELKARVEQLEREMGPEKKPLLADLASVGIQVDSVWDLVNAKWDYHGCNPDSGGTSSTGTAPEIARRNCPCVDGSRSPWRGR